MWFILPYMKRRGMCFLRPDCYIWHLSILLHKTFSECSYHPIHSALFRGLRLSIFWTSMCGIPNCSGWSPRPDFDGFDHFHRWILQKSQGEAGKGGAIWRSPDASNEPEKKFLLIIFFSITTFICKFFQILHHKNGEMLNLLVW